MQIPGLISYKISIVDTLAKTGLMFIKKHEEGNTLEKKERRGISRVLD